jgi:hypothetical protein
MPVESVDELRALLPQLTVEQAAGTNHFSVCIGETSNALVVHATQKALARG